MQRSYFDAHQDSNLGSLDVTGVREDIIDALK
jgi:hypothetical protein